MIKEISLVAVTPKYVVVNKPSGVQCHGTRNYKQFLQPQLYKHLKNYFADSQQKQTKLDPNEFKIVQRLDKYTSGGLVVGRGNYGRVLADSLAGRKSTVLITRRYVGILPLEKPASSILEELEEVEATDNGWLGHIRYNIEALARDYNNSNTMRPTISYSAHTKFNLINTPLTPEKLQNEKYPGLYKNKTLYPIVFELVTGRKNQIRDHVTQAFSTTLLNDDKFSEFKMVSSKTTEKSQKNPNSELFTSNQIGLHSGYIGVGNEHYMIPVPNCDCELWSGFLDSLWFKKEIAKTLRYGW